MNVVERDSSGKINWSAWIRTVIAGGVAIGALLAYADRRFESPAERQDRVDATVEAHEDDEAHPSDEHIRHVMRGGDPVHDNRIQNIEKITAENGRAIEELSRRVHELTLEIRKGSHNGG